MSEALKSRCISAIVAALSITASFGLAFAFSLDRPFWAAFTAMVISLSTIGQSALKALLRISGSALGACMGLFLLSLAPQQHVILLVLLYLYIMVACYCMISSRNSGYFFYTAAIVAVIIILGSIHSPLAPFTYAVARLEETALGVAVYSFFALLLWKGSSVAILQGNLQTIAALHGKIFAQLPTAEKGADVELSLYASAQRLLALSQTQLPAARLESYRIRSQHREWESLFQYSRDLLQCQSTLFSLLQRFDHAALAAIFPQLQQAWDTVALYYQKLTAPDDATPLPALPPLIPLNRELETLSLPDLHTVQGIVHAFSRQGTLCAALWEHIRFVTTANTPPLPPDTSCAPRQPLFTLRHLRLLAEGSVAYWGAVAIWLLLNPPGAQNTLFVELSIIFGLVFLMVGDPPPLQILGSFTLGLILAGVVYFGCMPLLHGFTELSILLFLLVFAICFYCYLPSQGFIRTALLSPLFTLTNLTNEKTFDPVFFFPGALGLLCCVTLMAAISYLFSGAHPGHRFFQKQISFLRAVNAYLTYLSQYADGLPVWWLRLRAAWHLRQIRELPSKLVDLAFAFEEKAHGLPYQSVKEVALSTLTLGQQVEELDAIKGRAGTAHALRLLPAPAAWEGGLWSQRPMEDRLQVLHGIAHGLGSNLGNQTKAQDGSRDRDGRAKDGRGKISETAETASPQRQHGERACVNLLNALRSTLDSATKVAWAKVNVLQF